MKKICLPLLLLLAILPRADAQQTQPPETHWSLARRYVANMVRAIDDELERLAEQFPQLSDYGKRERVKDLSIFYQKGPSPTASAHDDCIIKVEFRYPLGAEEALPSEARVFTLKDGKRLAMWSSVSAGSDPDGKKLERAVGRLIRSKQAQLLDLLGADTRGSTRDLEAVPFEGTLTMGTLYRAELVFDKEDWEWRTSVPVRPPAHHAAAIEWANLTDFLSFYFDRSKDGRAEVVFELVEKEVEKVGPRRWSTTYHCRILSVEGTEPPRAEYLTLVAKCREVRHTGKRNVSFYFTFEVRRVIAGSFDASEFTMELTSHSGGQELLRVLGGDDGWDWKGSDCATSKEVEMIFEVPKGEHGPRRPGLLQEFRVIE